MNKSCQPDGDGCVAWDKYHLPILIVLSVLSGLCVYRGFATSDSIMYAGVINGLKTFGLSRLSSGFNDELSFGYYLLLAFMVKLLPSFVSLSWLMNNLSLAASICMLACLFILARSLYNSRLAFYACLLVMTSPTIWFLSHYGHPTMISMALFMISLVALDRIFRDRGAGVLHYLVFLTACLGALSARLDIILMFGVYLGIALFNTHADNYRLKVVLTISAVCLALSILVFIRYLLLGYVIPPGGGVFWHHASNRLHVKSLILDIPKNIVQWVLGGNCIIMSVALFALFILDKRSKEFILLICSVAPYVVFLPFAGMDIARITAPSVPIVTLVVVYILVQNGYFVVKNRFAFYMSVIVLSQLLSFIVYFPLTRIYHFRTYVNGRALASFPIGTLWSDQYYRQIFIEELERKARDISEERRDDVLIIDAGGHSIYYYHYLVLSRPVKVSEISYGNIELVEYKSPMNKFYVFRPYQGADAKYEVPIKGLLSIPILASARVHVVPFTAGIFPDYRGLYLEKSMVDLLAESRKG